jgi:hypothetical protein
MIAAVKVTQQPARFRSIDARSTRLSVVHTLSVVPKMLNEDGTFAMDSNWFKNYTKACSDCLIKYIGVALDGYDGRNRLTSKPTLDRVTMSVEGQGRVDSVCGASYPHGERILHLARGGKNSEAFFFSPGEDRSAGIWLGGPEDKLSMSVQVDSIPKEAKTIAMNVTVEFIPTNSDKQQQRAIRSSFKTVKGVFLDLAACGPNSPVGLEVNEERNGLVSGSMTWISPFNGRWLSAVGQDLNVGGRTVDVSSNGQIICSSTARYFGSSPEDSDIDGYEHCSGLAELEQGDKIEMKATYDSVPNGVGVTGGLAAYVIVD